MHLFHNPVNSFYCCWGFFRFSSHFMLDHLCILLKFLSVFFQIVDGYFSCWVSHIMLPRILNFLFLKIPVPVIYSSKCFKFFTNCTQISVKLLNFLHPLKPLLNIFQIYFKVSYFPHFSSKLISFQFLSNFIQFSINCLTNFSSTS